jgi:ATPase subunit of ABC transporter with duplicated ATPase domains
VVGPNGSGKTTLLRILAGALAPDAGTVRLGLARDEVAWVDQQAAGLRDGWSVLENCRAANPGRTEHECRVALARFLFRGDAALVPAGALSGGERLRAALACALDAARPPALLLLDEPTNHLDLAGIEAVEAALRGYDGAIVAVSHDRDFLDAIGVERTIRLGAGG